MRLIFITILFVLCSCAHQAPERKTASAEIAERLGHVDHKRSLVQIYQAQEGRKENAFYLYVQLRDKKGRFVDAKPSEFNLKNRKGSKIDFDFERFLVGRYYLIIPKSEKIESHEIDLLVQGKMLKEQFKLQMKRPHEKYTKLKVLKNKRHKMMFELRLADNKNRPVEAPEAPELLIDGPGTVVEVKHIREGIWQITVSYPDENHITYFGVRSMGITFQKLYRYQHIEKWTREPATSCSRNIFCN